MLSFYLDYYPGYRDKESMKVIRHESLGIYIYAEPKNQREQNFNAVMSEKAEAIRCRRFESIVNERYDFFDKSKMKGDFLAYYKKTQAPPTTQKPDDSANQDNETPPPKVPETPEPEKPEESEPAESSKPKFNINDWITFTKSYAGEVGLILNSEAVECWDNPIPANENSTTLEQSIKSRLNLYARNGDITDVWVWAVEIAPNSYEIYIGYA